MILEIVADLLQVGSRSRGPTDTHSGIEHRIEACVHLFLVDEFTPVCLSDTFADSGTKTGVLFNEAQRRFLYKMLCVGSGAGGDLRKLCFLISGERHFHDSQGTEKDCAR